MGDGGAEGNDRAFALLTEWVARLVVAERCPGALVGLSGTDSAIVALACHRAFASLGRAGDVEVVHYGPTWPPANRTPEEATRMVAFSPDVAWVPRVLVPWLRDAAPGSTILVEPSPGDDNARWAALLSRSVAGVNPREPLTRDRGRWVFGTRNATEDALGAYSNLSRAASVQPLLRTWKSEVLAMCEALGVPEVALRQSRTVDCDCGRFDVAADHVDEVDAVLRVRAGLDDPSSLVAMDGALRARVEAFVDEQRDYASFKGRPAHAPPATTGDPS